MAGFTRGSTPTFKITIPSDAPSGSYAVVLEQDELRIQPSGTKTGNILLFTLSNSESAQFNFYLPAFMHLLVLTNGVTLTLRTWELEVKPNWYDSIEDPDAIPIQYLNDIRSPEYEPVEPDGTESPKELHWYEDNGNGGYILSTDSSVVADKDYYADTEEVFGMDIPASIASIQETVQYTEIVPEAGDNPFLEAWYEKDENTGNYLTTVDTSPVSGKTYYVVYEEDVSWELDMDDNDVDAESFDGDAYVSENGIEVYDDDPEPEDVLDAEISDEWGFAYKGIEDDMVAYNAVSEPTGNPVSNRYWELVNGAYKPTDDETVVAGKTYYTISVKEDIS